MCNTTARRPASHNVTAPGEGQSRHHISFETPDLGEGSVHGAATHYSGPHCSVARHAETEGLPFGERGGVCERKRDSSEYQICCCCCRRCSCVRSILFLVFSLFDRIPKKRSNEDGGAAWGRRPAERSEARGGDDIAAKMSFLVFYQKEKKQGTSQIV